VCSKWSICRIDGFQNRTCVDENQCGTYEEKPPEIQRCVYTPTCFDGVKNGLEEGIDCGRVCNNSCVETNASLIITLRNENITSFISANYDFEVVIENSGERTLKDIIVALNKWSAKKFHVEELSPGEKTKKTFNIKFPIIPGKTNLEIQVFKNNTLIGSKEVGVFLSIPELGFTIQEDESTHRIYYDMVVDTRKKNKKRLYVLITINKGRETYLIEEILLKNLTSGQIFYYMDYLNTMLPRGKYDVKAEFYENNTKLKEINCFLTLDTANEEENRLNITYLFYALLFIITFISTYLFIKVLGR